VVGGVRVCHLVGDRRGGSEPHHAERGSEGLWVPLPEPQCIGLQLL
jgi:hypothetical protein